MFVKTITYTDFFDEERTEDFYFNLTKSEIIKLGLSMQDQGGFATYVQNVVASKNVEKMIELIDKIIMLAYGKKSDDGRRFIKSKELSEEFVQTGAYDVMFLEFLKDEHAASNFIKAVVPQEALAEAKSI